MADAFEPFSVVVVFENRPDGGVRVYSDDVPGFILSHTNPDAVQSDIVPALETIISEMIGKPVRVTLKPGARRQRNPVTKIERCEYTASLAA